MTAIVDTQTNEFEANGHAVDARYVLVEVPRNPDPAREKYSGNPADPIVAKTPAEIAATQTALQTALAAATSQQKDKLADCAMLVRTRGIAAWNAMTLAQKKAATLAEADVWRDIRVFIENNL